ncbi:MAG: hypothetical protein V9F00_04775 [Nocardioides sp.]
MSELKLDIDELRRLYVDLIHASSEFTSVEHDVQDLLGVVGHPRVESAVRSFSSSWSVQRKEIVAGIDALWNSTGAVISSFNELDLGIAAQIEAASHV